MAAAATFGQQGGMPARFGAFLLALALSFAASTVASGRAAERAYDIPAQDLEKALLAFGRISGIDIVYEPAILKGMRSEPLRGRFSPPFAVATLLHGSGLAHRFTSATAVLILRGGTHVPDEGEPSTRLVSGGRPQLALGRLKVTAARVIGQPQTDYRPFGHVVQNTIMRRLQDHPATHNRRFEARLSVRIDAHGVIRTLHLASGSGNAALDGEVLRALDGMQLPAVPPPAMPQPVWFEIVQR